MSILATNSSDEKKILSTIQSFITNFKVAWFLNRCGLTKVKGVPVMALFTYIIGNAFRSCSFYMQCRIGSFREGFSKNTYYRFLQNPHANWLRFTTLLAEFIVSNFLRPLTSEKRDTCFVIDDSLFERIGFRRTELAARVFDHTDHKYKKGFRLLTLGWTDGCTFLPINSSLLSSNKDANVLGTQGNFDKRSLCGKRRIMARAKATSVMLELLSMAVRVGHKAKYVLFDSWFANPKEIVAIKGMDLDVIAMVKRSSKISYIFEGAKKNIKQIFSACKKRRGRSKYLLSVAVEIDAGKGKTIPARIVCVKNRNNKKDWIALISTNISLTEEDIIRIYGKRWDIEVFFKMTKSLLQLTKGYHGLSYDAMTAHVAIVFTRYMILAVAKRENEDDRTIGELFYLTVSEIADMTYHKAMGILIEAMMSAVQSVLHVTNEQMNSVMGQFLDNLPEHLRRNLEPHLAA